MPSELFGDVSKPASRPRTRGRTVVTISIGAHAVVLVGALFLSVSSPGLLPVPRHALAFVEVAPEYMPVDIELPAAPRPTLAPASSASNNDSAPVIPDTAINLAPVVAPAGISPDSAAESASRPNRSPGDVVERIENGTTFGDGLRVERIERLAAVATPQAPVRLHSGIRSPVKVMHVDPVYPSIAQRARVEGVVILEAVIGTSGRVESVEVLRSIPLLDQAAVSAVRQWQYRPAMLNDQPVPVIVTVTVNFKL